MKFEKVIQTLPVCTGAGVRVAILDSGVNPSMPMLKGKNYKVYDCNYGELGLTVEQLGPKVNSDKSGHGSFVQSCVYSVAPDVEVDHYRILDQSNLSDGLALCQALDHVISQGYHIINLSLGTRNEQHIPWLVTIMKRAYEKDTLIVAANSNIGNAIYPARFTYVLSCDAMPGKSALQLKYRQHSVIEFEGWGVNVPIAGLEQKITYLTGASYAAAHVTGLAARAVEALGNNRSPLDVKLTLREYALAFERNLSNHRLHA